MQERAICCLRADRIRVPLFMEFSISIFCPAFTYLIRWNFKFYASIRDFTYLECSFAAAYFLFAAYVTTHCYWTITTFIVWPWFNLARLSFCCSIFSSRSKRHHLLLLDLQVTNYLFNFFYLINLLTYYCLLRFY